MVVANLINDVTKYKQHLEAHREISKDDKYV